MPVHAVIFDLFGTLVPGLSRDGHRNVVAELATVLGAAPNAFAREWADTFEDRCLGRLGPGDGAMKALCARLGLRPAPEALRAAVALRRRTSRDSMEPRGDALQVFGALRARGLRLALCSDATWEIPALWAESPMAAYFDAAVFSCAEAVKKPDPRIFGLACERIGVEPTRCVYVGDGGSHELSGAAAVGMVPVLLRVPDDPIAYRVDAEDGWPGRRVESLSQVLAILDDPALQPAVGDPP